MMQHGFGNSSNSFLKKVFFFLTV